MAFSSLHLPAGSTSLRPEELAAVDCPWQRRHTQLCALGLDCPYYADPDQP